jgi:hypothetical protein
MRNEGEKINLLACSRLHHGDVTNVNATDSLLRLTVKAGSFHTSSHISNTSQRDVYTNK